MNCPLCDRSLDPTTLTESDGAQAGLPGFECPQGHGVFVPSDVYLDWQTASEEAAPETAPRVADSDEVGDVKRAKLCPQDGRIMRRFRISADGGFWIDRCSTCGGAWFDGDEWQATVDAGLAQHLPQIFSDAWQRRVEEALTGLDHRSRLAEAAGEDDLGRVDAFREWIWSHPQRHLLLARLNDRPAQT